MSLLPSGVVACTGKPYFASSAVNSQIYTAAYSYVIPNGTAVVNNVSTDPLPVGTFLASVLLNIYNTGSSSAATDILTLYFYSNGGAAGLNTGTTIPVGTMSAYLNSSGANYVSVTITGLITNTNPTKYLVLSVQRVNGSGAYIVIPYNISYVQLSPSAGSSTLSVGLDTIPAYV